jgi:hypothetical protein
MSLSGLEELASLGLANIDSDGNVPETRITSPEMIRSAHSQNRRDDEINATNRARVQASLDGEPPYNQASLNANGQGARANANFLQGRSRLNRLNNGYLDMVTSVKHLMTLTVDYGESAERMRITRILSEELTRTIRKWPAFVSSFMRLVDKFNAHGVGIAFWPDTENFRFSVCGFGDMLIPRDTPATEECIDIATAEKHMTVTELYSFIRDEEKAARLGWNVAAVKDAIHRATEMSNSLDAYQIETFQRQIKNGDTTNLRKFKHVKVVCSYVREFDGSISYAMVEKDNEGPFLFFEKDKYRTPEEAFVFFTYGIGNGTYHSIRGFGHLIYPQEQLINRTLNTAFDIASTGTLLESEAANSLQGMTITRVGQYDILPKGFSLVQGRVMPNMQQTLYPLLDRAQNMMDENASQFSAPSSDAYQNRVNVEASLEQASAGDTGSIDLFYSSFDRLIRTMVKRIVMGKKHGDPLVAEFHRRITAKGITPQMLRAIDHDNTYAFRAYGAGSPATRALFNKRLLELLPNLDSIGQKRLIFQIVSDIMGHQNADYYATEPEEPRLPVDAKMALLENNQLLQGVTIPVHPQEIHSAHVQEHIPFLMEILDKVERGEMDPMQMLPGLQAILTHVAEHGDALAQDPSQAAIYAQVKEAVNNMNQVVTNMERKIKAAERKGVEAGAPEGQAPGNEQALAELKLAQEQFKLELAQQIGQLKIAELQAKAQQNLALNDLKAAEMVNKQIAFPRTAYQSRR